MIKKTKSLEKWKQLLVSAIVTPNSFVVLNEILDEISVMETESSPSFVSGATPNGAWETITSRQRFAGWMASTLVPGTTFKIKLAYVKTVFQSVYDAAFLVELTSFVRLATLKIPKSLVVSESGSFSAAVALCDVPLSVFAADIKTALSVFGIVTHIVLKSAGIWQYVVVYFKKLDSVMSVLNHWSVLVGKNCVRILLLVNQNETILSCDRFKAKLVNLSPGCTVFKISNMISQVGDWSCFIPQSPDSGRHLCFALVTFNSQADLDLAVVNTKTGHLAVDCKVASSLFPKAPKMFKPHFVGSLSYVKTFAPPVMFEFSLLVAFAPSVAVVDPAVGSRLDSLEKQISDLAALIKSIVKPVGSLVALVSCFLDNNAVKTVQSEKNLFSMKYVSNNFANLLVGVSKNIAYLRSEVDFGGMDYDDMQTTKSFLLSKNTVERVIALWQMLGAKIRTTETLFKTEEESYQTASVFDFLSSESDSSTQTVTPEPMANDSIGDAQDPIEWLDDFERAATANQYDEEYKIIRWIPINAGEENTSFTT
ncbi:hypothetical protein G9A89_006116 [Geosiphon pyriformis]|nr:hypothetical protein G9A89_006116 [Geosiphon pyriformis]